MAKRKVIDVVLLSFRIPHTMSDRTARTVLRTLESKAFMAQLRRVARTVVARFPVLADVAVAASR